MSPPYRLLILRNTYFTSRISYLPVWPHIRDTLLDEEYKSRESEHLGNKTHWADHVHPKGAAEISVWNLWRYYKIHNLRGKWANVIDQSFSKVKRLLVTVKRDFSIWNKRFFFRYIDLLHLVWSRRRDEVFTGSFGVGAWFSPRVRDMCANF